MNPISEQTMKQKKIQLAQSEFAPVVIEMIKDCMGQTPLIADTEFKTLQNAITLDVHSNLIRRVVDYMEEIRQGALHEAK